MKKIKSILMLTIGCGMTALPIVASSCNLTDEQRADQIIKNQKTLSGIKTTNGISDTIKIEFNSSIPFTVKNGEISSVKELNLNGKAAFAKSITRLTQTISNKVKELIKLTYTPAQTTYLLPNADTFSNVPKYFKVEITQSKGETVKLLYVLSLFGQEFADWKTGEKLGVNESPNEEVHSKALKLKQMTALNNFKYNALNIGDYKSVKDLSVTLTKDTVMPIDPTFEAYPTSPDPKIFKKVNIDWSKIDTRNYFDGRITTVSDGDTYAVELYEDKDTFEGKFKKGLNPIKDKHDPKRDPKIEPNIRLSGIDTPEKAVSQKLSSPFEYAFALMPTHFADKLWSKEMGFRDHVRVAFLGHDAYGRTTADVFFGEDYQYSYNVEIVRAGLTLPMPSSNIQTDGSNIHSVKGSYEDYIYEQLAGAMFDAIKDKRGFFHYFATPSEVSTFIYLAKNNSTYATFENIYKKWLANEENK
ncbi:thermonuclease family protein [Mycoplasma sp. T193]|uniref:thermonuclease family protein n=1 Tax=unclassified Mycoplasma TaxID=2683645 RepID=UPI003AACB490